MCSFKLQVACCCVEEHLEQSGHECKTPAQSCKLTLQSHGLKKSDPKSQLRLHCCSGYGLKLPANVDCPSHTACKTERFNWRYNSYFSGLLPASQKVQGLVFSIFSISCLSIIFI